jgi:hypothetical protein
MTTAQLAKLGFKMGMSGWVRNRPAELAAALRFRHRSEIRRLTRRF